MEFTFTTDQILGRQDGSLEPGYSTDPPETRGVFRGFFAKKPSSTARGARERIGITARKRYMSTPFEGAWTVTGKHGRFPVPLSCVDIEKKITL